MSFLKKIVKLFLGYEARLVLAKYKPKVIAIIGGVGKTSTRDAVYLVLSKKFFVRKREKSFTAELGVPLAIIGSPVGNGSLFQWLKNILFGLKLLVWKSHYPEYLILEIDSDKPGDLKTVSQFLKPDVLIVTAIGDTPPHVELFGSTENYITEIKFLIDAVIHQGTVIYNIDDSKTVSLFRGNSLKKISCGTSTESLVRGSDFSIIYTGDKVSKEPIGVSFDITYKSVKNSVTILGSLGIHIEYACLLAFALGTDLGLNSLEIVAALNKFISPAGRMKIISGIKDTIIIDDSYNSSPVALTQAVEVLSKVVSRGKKIAVLGDMLELGKYSAEEHRKIAGLLKDTACPNDDTVGRFSFVICVGLRARHISEELIKLGFQESKIISVDFSEEAGKELQKIIETGDTILVKGSQAVRMERAVEEVMKHPEEKGKLLVRQEPEWLIR